MNRNALRILLGGLAVAALSTPAVAQDAAVQKAPVEPLVEASWLMDHLEDPDVVVLHVGGRPEGFAEAHIPGARMLGVQDIAWDGEQGWRVEFRDNDEMIDALRNVGVNQDSKVIIYGPRMTSTARTWVTFDFLGLGQQAFLLNGGLDAWKEAGGLIESGNGTTAAKGDVSAVAPVDFRVSAEWILDRLDDESVALIDARPDDEFTGDDEGMGGMANPGHIPGAAQLYWEELMTEDNVNRFRPSEELEDLLLRHGAGPDKTNVSYCMIGLRASVDYMAMRMMGWDVQFYDGSWHDWGTRDLPTALGADIPR
ncbi:MAG: sulfurtransferase [Longimicrobiales bacterium]